jgi:hypothetical protein
MEVSSTFARRGPFEIAEYSLGSQHTQTKEHCERLPCQFAAPKMFIARAMLFGLKLPPKPTCFPSQLIVFFL